jgi:hypothetical protein
LRSPEAACTKVTCGHTDRPALVAVWCNFMNLSPADSVVD